MTIMPSLTRILVLVWSEKWISKGLDDGRGFGISGFFGFPGTYFQ